MSGRSRLQNDRYSLRHTAAVLEGFKYLVQKLATASDSLWEKGPQKVQHMWPCLRMF